MRQLMEGKIDRKKVSVVVNRSHGEESVQRVRVALEDYSGLKFYELPFNEDLERDDNLDFAPAVKGSKDSYGKDFRAMAKKGAELEIKGPEKEGEGGSKKFSSAKKLGLFERFFGSKNSPSSNSSKKKKGGKKK